MFLNKPKFWNDKNLSFYSIIFYPLSLIVIFFSKIKKLKRKKKFKIPVICIGNIYIGGTGKTPLSIKVLELLHGLKKKPAIIKKFYPYIKDEISLLKKYGKVYTSKNRSNLIQELIVDGNNVAILDDGFQDNTIFKDLSILCFNEKQFIGNGLVIPSGPLREPLDSLKNAQLIFINGEKNLNFERKILSYNSSIIFYYFKYELLNKELFFKDKYIAFAGIGNPLNFFNILEENKIKILKTFAFRDHYKLDTFEIDKMLDIAKEYNAKLLTTEKDHHRLLEKYKEKVNYIKIKVNIENQDSFINYLKKVL